MIKKTVEISTWQGEEMKTFDRMATMYDNINRSEW